MYAIIRLSKPIKVYIYIYIIYIYNYSVLCIQERAPSGFRLACVRPGGSVFGAGAAVGATGAADGARRGCKVS